MTKLAVLFYFIIAIGPLFAQGPWTIDGVIRDERQSIAYAKISAFAISGNKENDSIVQQVLSDTLGRFQLNLPKGNYRILIQAFDYSDLKENKKVSGPEKWNFTLNKIQSKEIDGFVVVSGARQNIDDVNVGQMKLKLRDVKTIPAFMGEIDVIKLIQFLPGVASTNDGGQGFYVRGGGPDQNLVLIDGTQVYNASHLFGFFSVFNSDVVESANIIKGGMPANFGGRMSSVLEITSNRGNMDSLRVTGGLGLIASRLMIDGPFKNKKGSYLIAGRRTYIDLLLKAFIPKNSNFSGSGYYFHDINASADYQLGKKDKLFFSFYQGQDKFSYGNSREALRVELPWGNLATSLRWNHRFGDKLSVNTSISMTDYQVRISSFQELFQLDLSTKIRDYQIKSEFSYYLSARHSIKFGASYTKHRFTPVAISAEQDAIDFDTGDPQSMYGHESALFINDEIDVTEKWKINLGLRYNMYHFVGPFTRYFNTPFSQMDSVKQYAKGEVIQFYQKFEPRISTRYSLGKTNSIKGSFTLNDQYLHLASLSAVSLPSDIWLPVSDIARPQSGWQGTLGYFQNFKDNGIETSIELYYKKMNNLVEYQSNSLPMDNVKNNVDNLLVFGKGWSYGVEFFAKKNYGKFTGWVGYTLAKTERLFPDIQVDKFPAKYDRRHDLSLVATYQLNPQFHFGFAFIYATGNTLTLPSSWYLQDGDVVLQYQGRNSSRMAPYHRMDASLTYFPKKTKTKYDKINDVQIAKPRKGTQSWAFSIYNLYNRANPYFIYIDSAGQIENGDFEIQVKQVSLFPILPSVTWNFTF